MSVQTLLSFDSFSVGKEANAPISVVLSHKSTTIPPNVFEEFQKIFFDWRSWEFAIYPEGDVSKKDAKIKFIYNNPYKYSFSNETRNYFQSLMPLLDTDIQIITGVICKESFYEQISGIGEMPDWSEKDYDNFHENRAREAIESKKNWELFVMKVLIYSMPPTVFERLSAFVSKQTRKLLSIYEV